jgi:hypothetical protein
LIFFSLPNGDNKYFLRLTAIIDFSLHHGKNQGNRFACRLALFKCYLWSTRGAATFLAQNLLIVACSLCSSSYELNGLCAIFLWPYSRAPSMAIFSLALRPCLTGIDVAPHVDIYLAFRQRLTALIDFIRASLRRYPFFLRLTAIINLSLPHGKNTPDGKSRLTAIIDFFFASWG